MSTPSPARTSARQIVAQLRIYAENELCRVAIEDEIEKIISENYRKRTNSESDHARTIDQWVTAWKEFFGEPYVFTPKDAKAVKLLLSGDISPEKVMQVAQTAWRFRDSRKHFNCKFSVTLCGLQAKWNEIRSEIGSNATTVSNNPRNLSTY